ncbi:MAG TPA: tetratricopeptide repeat protein [Gemmatimonadales bacterium]|jgi:tetratricopeptide (TPR) repeat protein
MRKTLMAMACGVLLVGGARPAMSQQLIGGYAEMEAPCEPSMGHFLVNSAHLYMMHAGGGKNNADQIPKLMRDAFNALTGAIQQGQASNPAVWMLLGRWYEMEYEAPGANPANLIGADSSYRKAAALDPKCGVDIAKHRQRLYGLILNLGVAAQGRNDDAMAKHQFMTAAMILNTQPTPYYYVGNMAATESQKLSFSADSIRRSGSHADSLKADSVMRLSEAAIDSALNDYRMTIRLASDSANRTVPALEDMRLTVMFNVARLYHRRKVWDSAAAYYAKVRETHPNDAQALTGLATVYSAAGKAVQAQALYDTVIVLADSLDPLDLFAAGVELFKVNAFDRAAQAIRVGLKRDPYYRDALYNLANTYLSEGNDIQTAIDSVSTLARKAPPVAPARGGRGGRTGAPARPDTSALVRLRGQLKQVGDSMLATVKRLIDVDPHSKIPQRLLAQSYRFQGNDDSTLAAVQRVHDMTYDVAVSQLDVTATGAVVQGMIITSPGQPVAVPAVTFDFLDATGKVVTSGPVPGETIPANTAKPFTLRVTGAKIAAWRYKAGG